MLLILRTVENSFSAAKLTLIDALKLERTVAPPPSVRVSVRPVIGTRKVRTSHRGASPTKVNKVPLPSTVGVLDAPPQLVKAATARPIARPRATVRLIICLPSIPFAWLRVLCGRQPPTRSSSVIRYQFSVKPVLRSVLTDN